MGSKASNRVVDTKNIKCDKTISYDNMVDIENITRTWFQLMVNLNESPLLRSYFAHEKYDKKTGEWIIESTKYTHDFLTSGIVIYEVLESKEDGMCACDCKKLETIVITKESSEADLHKVTTLANEEGTTVVALVRWAGCGMVIPDNVKIVLDPAIVWPVLTFKMKDEDKDIDVMICNSPNKIEWTETSSGKGTEEGLVQVVEKTNQGVAKGSINVSGDIDKKTLSIRMPYTCASFDILTHIKLGDDDSELVVFTS